MTQFKSESFWLIKDDDDVVPTQALHLRERMQYTVSSLIKFF